MTGREPLRLVPMEMVWSGAADVLQTATDARAEIDRLERQSQTRFDAWVTALSAWLVSRSRDGKAKRHNTIGAVVGVVLLIVAMFIIISAMFASSARADGAVDAWEAEYGPAACDFLGEHPTIDGLSGVILGAEQMGLTARQAGEAVASSVLDMCPDRTPILRQFVMRYGPVSNV